MGAAAIGAAAAGVLILLPTAGHPYDLAVLTAPGTDWLRWGEPVWLTTKFGYEIFLLNILAQALAAALHRVGLAGWSALTVAWKLPLLAAAVAGAACLRGIAERLGPRTSARELGLIWLVSPIVLWVAVGHGQLEPLSVLCMLGGLLLVLDGRWFWAGMLVGVGTGIEYFPLVVAVALWPLRRRAGVRGGVLFATGLVLALGASFWPFLLVHVAVGGLTGQMASSAGLGGGAHPSLLSVWTVFPKFVRWWPEVAAAAAGTWALVARRLAGGDREAAVLSVAGIVTLAVLLDPNALPQFAVLVTAGALLLCTVWPGTGLAAIVLACGCGLASYFLDEPFNVFWFDAFSGQKHLHFWPFPESAAWAGRLAVAFALGTLAWWAYSLAVRRSALAWPAWDRRLVLAVSAAACLFLAVFGLQPPFWRTVLHGPAQLADAGHDPTVPLSWSQDGAQVSIKVPALWRLDAQTSAVHPAVALIVSVPALAGSVTNTYRARPGWVRRVSVPHVPGAQTMRVTISAIVPHGVRPGLALGPQRFRLSGPVPVGVRFPSGDWTPLSFAVPANAVEGTTVIGGTPGTVPLNGAARMWYRVQLRTGGTPAFVSGHPVNLRYHVDASGFATLTLPGDASAPMVRVILGARALPHYTIQSAALVWPAKGLPPPPWLPWAGGAWAAALLVGGATLVTRSSQKGSGEHV